MTDESLMARLFVNAGVRAGARHHAEPDWAALVRELKRPGVNLLVLWEEYRAVHPEGYAYSRYVAAKVMSRTLGKTSDMADFPGSVATYKGVFEWCATTPMIDGPIGATSLSRCEPP